MRDASLTKATPMGDVTVDTHSTRNRKPRVPRVLLAAIAIHVLAALALMPVAGQPYDLAALTSASQSWLRWGVPLFYHWKFGYDLALLGVGAQGLRYLLEQFGMSGAAAITTAWKLPLVLADLLVAITLLDLGRRLAVRRPAMLPTLWLLSPVPLWVSAGHGQIESLTVFSLVLALDLLLRHRFLLAGLVVGLGIGVEYLPAVVVLTVGLWIYLAVMQRRQAWRFLAGLALGLAVCFGPILINPTGRASLFSGLLSTTTAATQPGGKNSAIAFGSSLWVIFGIVPDKIWLAFLLLVAGTFLIYLAHKRRPFDDILDRQRIGMVATGGLILCVVLLDPGALPQFAELVLGGLCLVALGIEINPIVIIIGPLLQVSVEILSVYGGDFQSYWYDMWAKTGIAGWPFPQSVLAADWAARLGVIIIVIGLVVAAPAKTQCRPRWWALNRRQPGDPNMASAQDLPDAAISSSNDSNDSISLTTFRRFQEKHQPPSCVEQRFLRLSLIIASLGSVFLAVWSLQPVFWREVGSSGLQTLPDITSITDNNPGTISKTSYGATVTFPKDAIAAGNASAVRPALALTVQSSPLFKAEQAVVAMAGTKALDIVTIPNWTNERSDFRSLWVSILIGRSDWVLPQNRLAGVPRLSTGYQVVGSSAVRWVAPGWAIASYDVRTNQLPPSGRLQLSLREDGDKGGLLVWNGSPNERWVLITMHSGEASIIINGSTVHRSVTSPTPGSATRNTMKTTIQGLPLKQYNTITRVTVGDKKAIVATATIEWPSSSSLDKTVGRPWLIIFGCLDVFVLMGGFVTLWGFTMRIKKNVPPGQGQ